MTTNKPEVVSVYRTDTGGTDKMIRLSDYEALEAELKKAVAALTVGRFTRCDGPAGWRPPLGNPVGTLIDRIDSLEDENEKLYKTVWRLCNIYVVDDYYYGDMRKDELRRAVERAINAACRDEEKKQ